MFFTPAYHTLVVLVILLATTFLFLLAYTFWTRAKKQYWTRYKVKFRNYFLPMIFEFVEEARNESDADWVIQKLAKRTQDIAFFLEALNEMTEILRGEEREKLDWLINHKLFYHFYSKKLFSYSIKNQILACIYFEKSGYIDKKVVRRLNSLSKTKKTKLAYGAAKALQSSEDIQVRRNALVRFITRKDASDLMVGELLHLFHRDDMEKIQEVAEALKRMLYQKNIPADKKKIIILYIAHQNFYQYSNFLLQYLQKLLYGPKKVPLIIGLIHALGELHVEEAAPLIRKYAEIPNVELRLACVEALAQLGGEENFAFMSRLLLKIEFTVRKKIIKMLAQQPELGHRLLKHFLIINRKFLSRFRDYKYPPEDLRDFVAKFNNIALGIRIMMLKNKKMTEIDI